MNPILNALAQGYTHSQVMNYISSAFPSLAPSINQAKKYGYTPTKIINFLSSLFSGGEEIKGGTEAFQEKLSGEQASQKFKQLGALGASLYGASKALPALVGGARGTPGGSASPPGSPSPTLPSPQPPIGPQPMGGAPVRPPPIPPVGPIPPQQTLPAPLSPQSQIVAPAVNSQKILEEMGIADRAKNLASAGNPPDIIAAQISQLLTPGQRKWLDEKIKAGEAKPINEMVGEFLASQPITQKPQSKAALQEPIKPEVKTAPQVEERLDLEPPEIPKEEDKRYHARLNEEAESEQLEKEKEIDAIHYWDKYILDHTKNRDKPLKSTKDFIREAKEQQKVFENHYAKGHNPEEYREMHESLQKYINHLQELDALEDHEKYIKKNLKKGITVLDSETGEVGTLKDHKQKEALVDEDGKLRKAKVEDLIPSPLPNKDLAELFDDLNAGIEKEIGEEVSRAVRLLAYYPESNSVLYVPWQGVPYLYDDISEEDRDFLLNNLQKRRTTGENLIGAWKEGTHSVMGSKMHDFIRKLQSERGGKGNEYSAKFQIVYDPHKYAIEAKKEKMRKRKKK